MVFSRLGLCGGELVKVPFAGKQRFRKICGQGHGEERLSPGNLSRSQIDIGMHSGGHAADDARQVQARAWWCCVAGRHQRPVHEAQSPHRVLGV